MDGRRRQRWENDGRSYHKKPPRVSWQPAVPSWEKEFCKVVGLMDWDKLLQMKKFTHLYKNVIEWNDSAGEEAFNNAKKLFCAKKNGYSCDILLPDPDLYIDKIDWDSKTDPEMLPDLESHISGTEEDSGPVVIFGDSFMQNQHLPPTGWGDVDSFMQNQHLPPTGWGDIDSFMQNQHLPPTGWGDVDENFNPPAARPYTNYGDPWGNPQSNWGLAATAAAAAAPWRSCSDDAWQNNPNHPWQSNPNDPWQCGGGSRPGYNKPWEGDWNNDGGWNYANNYNNYAGANMRGGGEQGNWNDNNVATANGHGYRNPRVQANEERRNHASRNADGHRRPPYSRRQYGRDRRNASRDSDAIPIIAGQTWDRE